jgi:hypothetical protein
MDWYLSTSANVLQIVVTLTLLPAAFRWVRDMAIEHPLAPWLVVGLMVITATVSAAALAYQAGWLPKGWFAPKMEAVYRRTFKNEEVILDNKEFIECTFDTVTIKWNGGDYYWHSLTVIGTIRIMTDVPTIGGAFNLLNSLNAMAPGVKPFLIPRKP